MEHFDVIIIGGGSAGLAALKEVSRLGKQAVLLEAGKTIGSKNISGGILYSKSREYGQVHNVEDIYGQTFLDECPYERMVTKYVLNLTSKDKVFSLDLTSAHEYQTNYACSVLLNKLNSWFAKEALLEAEKQGGGIVPGVHVSQLKWEDESTSKTIVVTDELEEFEAKVIIAADGVNSEIAELVEVRNKFSTEDLYQGVKVVVDLPEEIIEKRFDIEYDQGVAHLFAGDISLNHVGGGFLYTNRNSLSIGGVYHFKSLIEKPTEPYEFVDALLTNPSISEYIKDEVPIKEIDKSLPQEEQTKKLFTIVKLLNNWNELRQAYYSRNTRRQYIESGKFSSDFDLKEKMESIRSKLIDEYGIKFTTNYKELEFSAKLIPDGKRCRMIKPYYKNILFIGDAAGRGIFIGPRIEGLNVGIDDGARAAKAVVFSLDKNNLDTNYMGEYYTNLTESSPYTRDMKEIDKNYLKVLLGSSKSLFRGHILDWKYKILIKFMSNDVLRDFAVGLINKLGYNNFLSFLESDVLYTNIPVLLAEKLGSSMSSSYIPNTPSLSERVAKLNYNDDHISHIRIIDPESKFIKNMVKLCPTKCYSNEGYKVVLQHEGCIECGACSHETEWKHPRGEKGIHFRYG